MFKSFPMAGGMAKKQSNFAWYGTNIDTDVFIMPGMGLS